MEKIYITGTGRCGTTFLIKLFSFLGLDTGFNKSNYAEYISKNCNSGMEKAYNKNFTFIKNPAIIQNISTIVRDTSIRIKAIIIPIRDYELSAESRLAHKKMNGGLWCATDKKTQIDFYNKLMANYVYTMTKYDLHTVFLDFDKMVSDKQYVFDKLKFIMDEYTIDFTMFSNAYDEASETSKP
jgi:hypothetical protein